MAILVIFSKNILPTAALTSHARFAANRLSVFG
jgi:hypothetical protein